MAAPTNQNGHKNATDPLLDHLLNLWFRSFAHDSESIGMGDRSHGGSTQPRHPENRRDAPHGDQDKQIPVKTRSFHHLPFRFAHNQPNNPQRTLEENPIFIWSIIENFIYSVTHVVIWDSRKMRMKTSTAGTQQAAIIQMGKSFFIPMGLMNQPLAAGLVTSIPFGTTSFYKGTELYLISSFLTKKSQHNKWKVDK